MERTIQEKNKDLVLKAFDTLFNKRDYATAETFWSPKYIQHSAHIEPGREGLFKLVKSIPASLKYEPGVIVAEGEFVIVHGRFSGMGLPVNWIAADILRIESGSKRIKRAGEIRERTAGQVDGGNRLQISSNGEANGKNDAAEQQKPCTQSF